MQGRAVILITAEWRQPPHLVVRDHAETDIRGEWPGMSRNTMRHHHRRLADGDAIRPTATEETSMKTNRVSISIALVMVMSFASANIAGAALTITQTKANEGGVTPGDAPGFPVTLSRPGSYILAGNLRVPDGNTTAIVIASDHVTLDLGGYAILGPVDCSGGTPCVGAGVGHGITTANVRFNITIRNGTVQGFGKLGIYVIGDSHLIEYIHARSNGGVGIAIEISADNAGSIVQFNTVQRNGDHGLFLSKGIARHNVADVNGASGIVVVTGSVTNNVATRNRFVGLSLGVKGAYLENVLDENGGGPVAGGVNMGRNLCGTVLCP